MSGLGIEKSDFNSLGKVFVNESGLLRVGRNQKVKKWSSAC